MTDNRYLRRLTNFAHCALLASMLSIYCLPASAITLTRCKVDNKFVYSDTECPDARSAHTKRRGQSEFSSGPASRPVTVKLPRKQSVGMKVPRKSRTSRSGS